MLGLHCCTQASLVEAIRGYSSLRVLELLITETSCCRAQAPGCVGFSACGSQAVEQRLTVVAHRGLVASHHVGDLLEPGIKPVSPALCRRFLNHWTTREAWGYFWPNRVFSSFRIRWRGLSREKQEGRKWGWKLKLILWEGRKHGFTRAW